jgi:plasmid stabilization system protein ParE
LKYSVEFLDPAWDDYRDITVYLSDYGEGPIGKFLSSLRTLENNLSIMPEGYPVSAENAKYRKAVIAYQYVVYYSIDYKKNLVELYRILKSSRDRNTLLT